MQCGYDILTVQETYGCGVVITKRIDPVPWGPKTFPAYTISLRSFSFGIFNPRYFWRQRFHQLADETVNGLDGFRYGHFVDEFTPPLARIF
jgi:hypothetical protein